MTRSQHTITTEPVKDDDGTITWTAECSCGKWTAAGPNERGVMGAHWRHYWTMTHATPNLSARLDAIRRGRKE